MTTNLSLGKADNKILVLLCNLERLENSVGKKEMVVRMFSKGLVHRVIKRWDCVANG